MRKTEKNDVIKILNIEEEEFKKLSFRKQKEFIKLAKTYQIYISKCLSKKEKEFMFGDNAYLYDV